ncbi:uncharacterized protein PV09_01285 [Verruconis gallopava]|uniref:Uncharacterized protein n=1 Tax=Verruconis gallopava TaxID=253628 RepID=A0A0D2BAL7_9PEZI|nr:uncharacterized protein PV09_01285 [Verruconis gallopava]KIW08369.1 hypothetical protein PV09_01285 [Verruconis gallopava]
MAPINFKPLDIPAATSFDFADSFEGTNIPKPPPSPPPPAPKVIENKANAALSSHPTTPTNGDVEMKDAPADASTMPPPATTSTTTKLSPASPTSSQGKRPSSVRKLLSLRSLREKDRNSQALNGSKTDWNDAARPGSPYGAPSITSDGSRLSLARKRSSGWFGSRRKSGFFGGGLDENSLPDGGAVQPVEKKGPPPPTIPEFKEFGSINGALSDGSLGAEDMFKHIKG